MEQVHPCLQQMVWQGQKETANRNLCPPPLQVASGTDPIWGNSHTFDIARNPTHEVEFRVSDKDRLSRDDFIGRAALPIGSITKAAQPGTAMGDCQFSDGNENALRQNVSL